MSARPGPIRLGQGRTLQADAEAVDQAQLDAFDDLGWNLLEAGRSGKFRELTRRVSKQRWLRVAHDVADSSQSLVVTLIFLLPSGMAAVASGIRGRAA